MKEKGRGAKELETPPPSIPAYAPAPWMRMDETSNMHFQCPLIQRQPWET